MAKKEDRKKQKQRRKEQQKAAETSKYLAAKARLTRYPEIVFETSEGNGYFVAEVRAAAKDLDFDSPEMGPDWMRQFYRRLRSEGYAAARQWLANLEEEYRQRMVRSGIVPTSIDDLPHINAVPTHLGDRIFERIPIETRRRFLPMNDFSVTPMRNSLLIRFSSLLEEHGNWGTVYYSRLLPKVEIGGKRVTMAFSDHAIRQLCARRKPRYLSFGANGDAHAYLAKCIYHEVVKLADGSPVIRLWDCCDYLAYFTYRFYVEGVFGEHNRKQYAGLLHNILGYCPFVLENSFAKAKSFLYPGFRGTPERQVLENGGDVGAKHAKWLDEVDHEDSGPFGETEQAFEVTKWLHENGAPQVVQMKRTVRKLD